MTPVTFNDTLGWLHTPRGGVGRVAVRDLSEPDAGRAVSHVSLRLLADRLAEAGYWALRFDYPGTGDSAGRRRCRAARGPLEGLAEEHRRRGRLAARDDRRRELVLCGLRIGATLATLVAAERHDVAGVIQLAPVVRGNSYVRQLLVQAQLQTGQPLPPDQDLIFYEFRLARAPWTRCAPSTCAR